MRWGGLMIAVLFTEDLSTKDDRMECWSAPDGEEDEDDVEEEEDEKMPIGRECTILLTNPSMHAYSSVPHSHQH